MTKLIIPATPTDSVNLEISPPEWFQSAVDYPCVSRRVEVDNCRIHYLFWDSHELPATAPGLLLVHGGGAHANWWRFIAPHFANQFRVAAIDLSGMGDSGTREQYSAEMRAKEMLAVIKDAGFGDHTFIIGHSFGGFMTMRFGVDFGASIVGAIIADSPVRPPDDPPPGRGNRVFNVVRTYADYEEAVSRFRLIPDQTCDNDFIVEFIARHSLRKVDDGWVWKFDPATMGANRWQEPFHEHMKNMQCRTAYIYGERSALVGPKQLDYVASLMRPHSPLVGIEQAAHHLMLDQPLAFVAVARAIIDQWLIDAG
ncbi:MAG: alpha/beta fold hydrolase [Gammaproteobacteria bacterium]